ncbi:hypothetical protein GAJ12_26805, partial [Escherichia coli]|nr:hypothetical protein [Escherichia coli]
MNAIIHDKSNIIHKHSVFASLCILFILLAMCINDLPVQLYGGTLAASPIWILSVILLIITLLRNNYYLHLDPYSYLFLNFFILSFTISFIQCVYYYLAEGVYINNYGVSIIGKLFFASSYYFVFFLVVYCSNYLLCFVSKKTFINILTGVSFFLFLIMVIEYIDPSLLSVFHLTMDGYGVGARLRLLSPEPSIAAFTFNLFIMITLTFSKNIFLRIFYVGLLILGNLVIGSKSSLILIVCAGLLVFYLNLSFIQKLKSLILLIPSIVLCGYVTVNTILPALTIDVEQFSSVSTRLITSIWALLSLLYYPLGEGYGTYTVWFTSPLESAIDFANEFVPFSLNLSEINAMINTGNYLSAKSGILSSVIYSGFIAVMFFFLLFKKSFKDISLSNIVYYQKISLRIVLWYTFLSLLLAVNIEVLYVFLLP